MGDIMPSKMPKGKKIVRKDNPNDVEMYKKGGKVKIAPEDYAKEYGKIYRAAVKKQK
jgi:hypothetical protein